MTEQGEMILSLKEGRFMFSFTVKAVKHWNKLFRNVVDAPSLETFKVKLDLALGNLIQVWMSWFTVGDLDQMNFRSPFLTPRIL